MNYYEFILKIKPAPHASWQTKYRCVAEEERYDWVYNKYLELYNKDPKNNLLLINKLDENKEFLEIIQ